MTEEGLSTIDAREVTSLEIEPIKIGDAGLGRRCRSLLTCKPMNLMLSIGAQNPRSALKHD
jgi:hypothetical protein